MDIDAKLKAVALSDNKLGLLQGKLGASIYFFVMSNHDEKSEMFQTGKVTLSRSSSSPSSYFSSPSSA